MIYHRRFRTIVFSLVLTLALIAATVPAVWAQGVTHVVQRGDTLYSIARRYGVTVQSLVQANGILNPNLIYVGQRLSIPGATAPAPTPTPPPATGVVHVVAPGETLTRIALRYGVTVYAIVSANNLANPNLISVGQRLTIPGGAPPGPAPTPAPTPGPILSGFQLGGQAHALTYAEQMRHAGMSWVKFQVAYSPGASASAAHGLIQQGHAAGFKVLLSLTGRDKNPASIDFAGFISFVTEVARGGPDAIEVWNEANIDREWPAGQISPTAYVQQLLAPAYRAIKAVNPAIVVISGALAPTGYFGGRCTGAGCDDAPYLAAMRAAGATSSMDCVGVHYNEGILPPSQTSGDPRGNPTHYTRYFWTMVNTYYNALGGQRPLCFTELGYLSPEDYGTLPAAFSWAANTTIAQHAAWLAQAAQLARSSGKVRLLIVYNVDFTEWGGDDPQAGYAILRRDGSCPACETLHAVMH